MAKGPFLNKTLRPEFAEGFDNMKIEKVFNRFISFLKEIRVELQKVNWPTRQEAFKYTLIVIAISTVIAIFLGGLDFLFTILRNKFIL